LVNEFEHSGTRLGRSRDNWRLTGSLVQHGKKEEEEEEREQEGRRRKKREEECNFVRALVMKYEKKKIVRRSTLK
jgi:hypothetical protein